LLFNVFCMLTPSLVVYQMQTKVVPNAGSKESSWFRYSKMFVEKSYQSGNFLRV